jgi:hypothetical protein
MFHKKLKCFEILNNSRNFALSSKLTLIHEDLQELINITRSRNDINVSQIVDTLKRELKISFNIVEEQPFL